MSGEKIEKFLINTKRLLKYATKPNRRELYTMTLIVILGLLFFGVIGYIVRLAIQSIIGG